MKHHGHKRINRVIVVIKLLDMSESPAECASTNKPGRESISLSELVVKAMYINKAKWKASRNASGSAVKRKNIRSKESSQSLLVALAKHVLSLLKLLFAAKDHQEHRYVSGTRQER